MEKSKSVGVGAGRNRAEKGKKFISIKKVFHVDYFRILLSVAPF